jgi:hypothetical protein
MKRSDRHFGRYDFGRDLHDPALLLSRMPTTSGVARMSSETALRASRCNPHKLVLNAKKTR